MSHWPQLAVLGALALSFAVSCQCAGQAKGVYRPVMMLIGAALELFVLFKGGFFAPLEWPA